MRQRRVKHLHGHKDKSKKAIEKDKRKVQNDTDFEKLLDLLPTRRSKEVRKSYQLFCDLVVKVKAGSTGTGSGWVKHILSTRGPCPCRSCIKKQKPESEWYEICVVTSQEVFANAEGEAWSTDVEFSFTDGTKFTSTGVEIEREYEDGLCMFTSATHNTDLYNKLEASRSSIFYGSDVPFTWYVNSIPSKKDCAESVALKVSYRNKKMPEVCDKRFETDDAFCSESWAPVLVLHFTSPLAPYPGSEVQIRRLQKCLSSASSGTTRSSGMSRSTRLRHAQSLLCQC